MQSEYSFENLAKMTIAGYDYPIIPINISTNQSMASGINRFRTQRNLILAEFIDQYRVAFPFQKNYVIESRKRMLEKLDNIVKTRTNFMDQMEVIKIQMGYSAKAGQILSKYEERMQANNSNDWHEDFYEEYSEVEGMAKQKFSAKDVSEWKQMILDEMDHYQRKSKMDLKIAKDQAGKAVELSEEYDNGVKLLNSDVEETMEKLQEVIFAPFLLIF